GGLLLIKLFYNCSFKQIGIIKDNWLFEMIHGILIGTVASGLLFAISILINAIKVISYDIKYLFSLIMISEIFNIGIFAFVEEYLTRGCFMTALKTTRKKVIILFTSAILFSLLHIFNKGVTLLSTVNTFLAGILFSYMFIKSGKLWLPAGFHFAWNFLHGSILGFIVSGYKHKSVIVIQLGNNPLLLGGSYGPEGGILVTALLLLCLLYVKFAIKTTNQSIWTMENDLPLTRKETKTN
ncbi:MAG: CPBP family intramembrane metalloprotease, partial [Brevinematales bacterium]|nr:CPBP family intramembrane metalloprotease [Brevinematales bacterium]